MKTIKKINILDFKLSKSIGNLLFGVYTSKFSGGGMDFMEHREYNFGDPVKFINWKASSKGKKIYSKVFEEERDIQVLFLLDISPSMSFYIEKRKKLDILEEIFYALAISISQNNDRFGAYIYGKGDTIFIPYKKEKGNIFRVLHAIGDKQNIQHTKGEDIADILEKLDKKSLKKNLIFILSDNLTIESYERYMQHISVQNEIIFIHIADFFENNLSLLPIDITLKDKNNFLQIPLTSEKKIGDYIKLRQKKRKIFEKLLKKNTIQYIYIDTKMNVFKELIKQI